jgi:2,4-dienoyl-CoA reductase-like NADH-dependent reductase (Old Yellow Enzyme family)
LRCCLTAILLTLARIGGVTIKNRIVMPPMTTRTADDDGCVTADTIAYDVARAEGGVGLITAEMASPERAGRHRRRELGVYDDRFLPGLTRLADAIHRGGAKASIQLGLLVLSRPDLVGTQTQGSMLSLSRHPRVNAGIRPHILETFGQIQPGANTSGSRPIRVQYQLIESLHGVPAWTRV